jgi:hypothetical protein
MSARPQLIVRELLGRCGSSYAGEAGIRLADRPGPLYQLLVLATLASARTGRRQHLLARSPGRLAVGISLCRCRDDQRRAPGALAAGPGHAGRAAVR